MAYTEIKTCPHCGGVANLYKRGAYKGGYYVFVQCDICGATGKTMYSTTDPAAEDWDNDACNIAITAWNMRNGAEKTAETDSKK